MTPARRLLVVTPCRDEAEHLEAYLASVEAQELPPTRWVVVDDGSRDQSSALLAQAAARIAHLEVRRRERGPGRAVGGGVVQAFEYGLEGIDLSSFDYVCKLDADLELPPGYFREAVDRLEADPRLGNLSGKVWVRQPDGRMEPERMGDENAIGAAKLYRVACYLELGGFEQHVGWDGIDGHLCRLKGWIARSLEDPALRVVHRRPLGSSDRSVWIGRQRWGRGKHFMGSSLRYVAASAARRAAQSPPLVGSAGILAGYLRARLGAAPRCDYPGLVAAVRRFEHTALVRGRAAAIRQAEARARRGGPSYVIVGGRTHADCQRALAALAKSEGSPTRCLLVDDERRPGPFASLPDPRSLDPLPGPELIPAWERAMSWALLHEDPERYLDATLLLGLVDAPGWIRWARVHRPRARVI
jgi:poly-beta-1,6-N-acetyl-D-glucosamine synthase